MGFLISVTEWRAAMRQTPTHLEFHATRYAVIHYPYPREGDSAQEE